MKGKQGVYIQNGREQGNSQHHATMTSQGSFTINPTPLVDKEWSTSFIQAILPQGVLTTGATPTRVTED